MEPGEAHAAYAAIFAQVHQGIRRVAPAEQVLGEIQPGSGEPLRAGHPVHGPHDLLAPALGEHAAEIPHRCPEAIRAVDGEFVEVGIAFDGTAPVALDGGHERGQVGVRDALGGRLPNRLVHRDVLPHRSRHPRAGTPGSSWRHCRRRVTARSAEPRSAPSRVRTAPRRHGSSSVEKPGSRTIAPASNRRGCARSWARFFRKPLFSPAQSTVLRATQASTRQPTSDAAPLPTTGVMPSSLKRCRPPASRPVPVSFEILSFTNPQPSTDAARSMSSSA